jgi:phage shock protein PspC (stress-responsive transcriptional regulator)
MKKVVNVNLSGNAYLLEEEGLEILSAYLESAQLRLKGNPDVEEIMADLEQSIADKMNRFLGANKTVVSTEEVEQIVDEMGPVDGAAEDDGAKDQQSSRSSAPGARDSEESDVRKLYKLTGSYEKMLTGVCAGIAAYSGIDVSIVRIIFIALTFASGGLVILFYLALAVILPAANTPQQHAAAYGVPFDAQAIIDSAKSKFDDLRVGKRWKSHERYWNRHARNAGFDGIGSVLGLVVVLFGILIGLFLLRSIFFTIGFPMYVGPPYSPGVPWWAIILMVIIGVYAVGWIFGQGKKDNQSAAGSVLVITVQAFLILFIIYVAFRILT